MLTKVNDASSQIASLLGNLAGSKEKASSINDKANDTQNFSDLFASVNAGALQQGQMAQAQNAIGTQFSAEIDNNKLNDTKKIETKEEKNKTTLKDDKKENKENDTAVQKDKNDDKKLSENKRAAEQQQAASSIQGEKVHAAKTEQRATADNQQVTGGKQAFEKTSERNGIVADGKNSQVKAEQQTDSKNLASKLTAENNSTAQGKQAEQSAASQVKQVPLNEMQQNNAILQQVKQDAQKIAQQGEMGQNQQQNPNPQQQKGGDAPVPNASLSQPTPNASISAAQASVAGSRENSFRELLNGNAKGTSSNPEISGNTSSGGNSSATELKVRIEPNQLGRTTHLEKLAQQVASTMKNFRFKPGSNELSVRIDPPHLGKLKISVTIDKGKVDANVVAENEAVKRTLEGHLSQLRGALEAQGLKVEQFTVNVDSNSAQEFASQMGGGNGKGGSSSQNRKNGGSGGGINSNDGSINLEGTGHYRASSQGVQVLSTSV